MPDGGGQELHCGRDDLTGPLGLVVQVLLAVIAFGALIVKRYCEPKPERRSWKIWFFDTSKQALGAAIIHFANVFLATMFKGDPCTWYIVSFLLDSTVGLLVIYIGLRISQVIVVRKGWNHLRLGEYGDPPQVYAWFGQCVIYIIVMFVEKFLMSLLVLFDFWKKVRQLIMSPIRNPKLELVIVMFIVPFVVNAFIFWVVDNFLKRQIRTSTPQLQTGNNCSRLRYIRADDRVSYYRRPANDEDTDSDILMATDDDVDSTHQEHSDELLTPDPASDLTSDRYRLLGPAIT
ncbi:Store-operated calcium entry regulator STIMATE [Lamellibrachia satsuma]|nr:Store-operated calcium entry regulator STIMATE [Lamellibrachia satsuma]